MSAAIDAYIASSPSRSRWKNEGTCARRIGAAASAPITSGFGVRRVTAGVDMASAYIAVRSERDHRPAPLDTAGPGRGADRARARLLEPYRAHRHRLPHVRSGGSRRPARWVGPHLRPGPGRGRAAEPGARPGNPTLPQPATGGLARRAARTAAVLARLLRLGHVQLHSARSCAALGLARARTVALGHSRGGPRALVGSARHPPGPGRAARGGGGGRGVAISSRTSQPFWRRRAGIVALEAQHRVRRALRS